MSFGQDVVTFFKNLPSETAALEQKVAGWFKQAEAPAAKAEAVAGNALKTRFASASTPVTTVTVAAAPDITKSAPDAQHE